jgi:superoxide dismutase, Cu-Zn family
MRLLLVLAGVASALVLAGPAAAVTARATLVDGAGTAIATVTVSGESGPTEISVDATRLPRGWHGLHLHSTGSCVGPAFESAGGHFNPGGARHPRHAGDLPPLLADRSGRALASFTGPPLGTGDVFDADGTAVVVHARSDNFARIAPRYGGPDATTRAAGDAGPAIACGVLEPWTPPPPAPVPSPVPPPATAQLLTPRGTRAGEASFHPVPGGLRVELRVRGLSPGFHGVHVHARGSCVRPTLQSAGAHLGGNVHPAHAGDLPALGVAEDAVGRLSVRTDRLGLAALVEVDRAAVVVHAAPDNYANVPGSRYGPTDTETRLTGDAGGVVACGVVERLARCRIEARPAPLRAGSPTLLRIRLSKAGWPESGEVVRLRGPGIQRVVRTDAGGRFTAVVRPTRRGVLTLSAAPRGSIACNARLRILRPAPRAPQALTLRAR